MTWYAPLNLLALAALALLLEWRGKLARLSLTIKGDIKRESRWLAQYGQLACTIITCILLAQLDGRQLRLGAPAWILLAQSVTTAALIGAMLKRILGRVRPGHEHAGEFLFFTWKHESHRESFPSLHTTCAFAFAAALAALYPPAAWTFWTLAAICGLLRYLLDAHWISDVLAGAALGYAVGLASALYWIGAP